MDNNIKALGIIIKSYGTIDYKTKDEMVKLVETATSKPLSAFIKVTHQLQFWLDHGETFTNSYGVKCNGLSKSSRILIENAYDTIKEEPLNNVALKASDAHALLEVVYDMPTADSENPF